MLSKFLYVFNNITVFMLCTFCHNVSLCLSVCLCVITYVTGRDPDRPNKSTQRLIHSYCLGLAHMCTARIHNNAHTHSTNT